MTNSSLLYIPVRVTITARSRPAVFKEYDDEVAMMVRPASRPTKRRKKKTKTIIIRDVLQQLPIGGTRCDGICKYMWWFGLGSS